MRAALALVGLVALTACDEVKKVVPVPTEPPPSKVPAPPFVVQPKVWGEAGEGATYEVRELPDGRPGLFTADGALLFHLLPEVVIDAAPAGKSRLPPTRKSFELLRLDPLDGGGFALFGKFSDENGTYELRVENGKGDPRVHVSFGVTWARDVLVHRALLVFRTGPVSKVSALSHAYEWQDVEQEYVDAAHTPNLVRFGPDEFTAMGRTGVEGVSTRRGAEDRWDVELEVYHYENHPLELGDGCGDEELDGTATFAKGSKLEMRADFILGATALPVALRYPEERRAAIALTESGEGSAARVVTASAAEPVPTIQTTKETWLGEALSKVPCENGRFSSLTGSGFAAAWSGTLLDVAEGGGNVFAPTEADARRVFSFHHPDGGPLELFTLGTGEPATAKSWFSEQELAELKRDRGLVAAMTDLDTLLGADASPTRTVNDAMREAAESRTIWVAPVGEVARRLATLESLEYDFLPDGVVRVRNPTDVDLAGLALLVPAPATARYNSDALYTNNGSTTYFDLDARKEQLLQLFNGDTPLWTARPASVTVVR